MNASRLPPLTESGDLPDGVHDASLDEVEQRFGAETVQRRRLAMRLARVYRLAQLTGQLVRFVVFGSFVTSKAEPNDIDVFMLMDDSFELATVSGEAAVLFDHSAAQAHFGASVFWLRRLSALPNEDDVVAGWQVKRDGRQRGIVEIIGEHS